MLPLKLSEITEAEIVGSWRVQSCILSKSDPESPFAKAQQHHFNSGGHYQLSESLHANGTWDLNTSDTIIKNPLLLLSLNAVEPVNAIVTRLLYSADKSYGQLTLYMSTGLELVLTKNEEASG